jgi:hypothetical protein
MTLNNIHILKNVYYITKRMSDDRCKTGGRFNVYVSNIWPRILRSILFGDYIIMSGIHKRTYVNPHGIAERPKSCALPIRIRQRYVPRVNSKSTILMISIPMKQNNDWISDSRMIHQLYVRAYEWVVV